MGTMLRKRSATVGLAVLAGFLGGVMGVAYANHQFPDVPNGQPHHNNVGRFVDAGCATGFGDGTYRPGDPITRGQAASQVVRCASRVTSDRDDAVDVPDFTDVVLASVFVRNLASTGEGGLVEVSGIVQSSHIPSDCPCSAHVRLRNATTGEQSGVQVVGAAPSATVNGAFGQATRTHLFELPPGAQHRYDLIGAGASLNGDVVVRLAGTITATYHPMGGAGIIIGAGGE